MAFEKLTQEMLAFIEDELQRVIFSRLNRKELEELQHMLAYHMGWENAKPEARGKRIRPLLVTLTCAASDGDWMKSLPAAAAVELIHNFSLIHDDIEDNSPLRRGRPTVWSKWGIPQAINAGDALFALAHLSLLGLEDTCDPEVAIQAAEILQDTCLSLTQGQFLDISFETADNLALEAYWTMAGGKTAALLSACTELGALVAGCPADIRQSYREFGYFLGMAFQVRDDFMGIWGDEELTGKSAESDLVTGKKSLPVLYGLHQKGKFYNRWKQGPIRPEEVPELAQQLASEGAQSYTKEAADLLTRQALQALDEAHPHGEAGKALHHLAQRLLNRTH